MARIRSIHPGQWTDEEFVACSFAARLLAIALRNEADDGGVFEWKPRSLKMRLMPADNVDIEALLAELVDTDQVRRFEAGGKMYGAVRNFLKFQRPQKPKPIHPLPESLVSYVRGVEEEASTDTGSVHDQYDIPTGIAPQMEDEGGRMEEKGESAQQPPSSLPRDSDPGPIPEFPRRARGEPRASSAEPRAAPLVGEQAKEIIGIFDRCAKQAWSENARAYPAATDAVTAQRWLDAGADPSLVDATASAVFSRMAAQKKRCPGSLKFLDGAISDAIEARQQGLPMPQTGSGEAGGYRSPFSDAERERMDEFNRLADEEEQRERAVEMEARRTAYEAARARNPTMPPWDEAVAG